MFPLCLPVAVLRRQLEAALLAALLGFWCLCSPHTFYVRSFCPLYLSKSRVLDILGREKGMRFLTLGTQRERAKARGKLSLFLHAEALGVESL